MRIIIDAMGGDNAPSAPVRGAVAAVGAYSDIEVLLVGDSQKLEHELSGLSFSSSRIKIVPTTQTIEMCDAPTDAIRHKKDSSMVVGLNLLASGAGQAFITAGSTGAALTGGMLLVKRIAGVKRPALAPILPTLDGKGVLLLDCGANADCKPVNLLQFAIMGSSYMNVVKGVKSPRVALLSNGTEDSKGNALVKESHALLRGAPVNFIGNCEARDVVMGGIDVCVCDGFSGNVFLKGMEGVSLMILKKLKHTLLSGGLSSKLGAALCKPAFATLKNELDYTQQGGALLLGVDGGIIKTHGDSDAGTITNTIRQARDIIAADMVSALTGAISACPLGEI